jgi:hypothetical protein
MGYAKKPEEKPDERKRPTAILVLEASVWIALCLVVATCFRGPQNNRDINQSPFGVIDE